MVSLTKLLLLFLFLFNLIAIITEGITRQVIDQISIYYFFLFLGMSLYVAKSYIKEIYNREFISVLKTNTLFLFFTLILSTLILCLINKDKSLWIDEYFQFYNALINDIPVTTHASHEFQPPIDYYLSQFSRILFGETKFAVRFHAFFYFILLSIYLPLSCSDLTNNTKTKYLSLFLILINYKLLFYGVEARPYIGSCLYLVIFLFSFSKYLNNPNDKSSSTLLGASLFLYCYSLGIQPYLFLFYILFLLILNFKQARQQIKKLSKVLVLTSASYIPLFMEVYEYASNVKKIDGSFSKKIITLIDKNYWLDYFLVFRIELIYLAISLPLIIYSFKRSNIRSFKILSFSLITFPFLYFIFLSLIGNNYPAARYFINNDVLFIFTISLCFPFILELIQDAKKRSYKTITVLLISLVSYLSLGSYYCSNFFGSNSLFEGKNYEKVYEIIESNNKKSIAMILNLKPLGSFMREAKWYFKEIYVKNTKNYYQNNFFIGDENLYIPSSIFKEKYEKLFIFNFYPNRKNQIKSFLEKNSISHQTYDIDYYYLHKVNFKEALTLSSYKDFLKKFASNVEYNHRFIFYETLAQYAIEEKNHQELKKIILNIEGLPTNELQSQKENMGGYVPNQLRKEEILNKLNSKLEELTRKKKLK